MSTDAILSSIRDAGLLWSDGLPTDAAVGKLRVEAAVAGDLAMVAVCDRAWDGDKGARAECLRVMLDAAAMELPVRAIQPKE